MTTALSVTGVALAAFCIWLGVRIVNRRERWAKWTAATLVMLFVVYPLSIGPVAWVKTRFAAPSGMFNVALSVVYGPILIVGLYGPQPLRHLFQCYERLWGLDEGGD